MNLPDLRRRILSGETLPIETLREAIQYQIAIRESQKQLKPSKKSSTSEQPEFDLTLLD